MTQWKAIGLVIAAVLLIMAVGCTLVTGEPGAALRSTVPANILPGVSSSVPVSSASKLVSRTYDATNFNRLDISGAFTVDVVQDASFDVAVVADPEVLDNISVVVIDNTLVLGLKHSTMTATPYRATIKMPSLVGLKLTQASRCEVIGFDPIGVLDVNVSEASTLKLEAKALVVNLTVSGASRATLTGTGSSALVKATGASQADLKDFSVATASVQLSGASTGRVRATERLDVNLASASRLEYYGNPTLGTIISAAASSLIQK